jgi:hypothetical protein
MNAKLVVKALILLLSFSLLILLGPEASFFVPKFWHGEGREGTG